MNDGADGRPKISVIIPAWRDAENLAQLLPRLTNLDRAQEVIVVDASRDDGTEQLARLSGAIYLASDAPNRGAQMNLGARAATGDILLFQHADTELHGAHLSAIASAVKDPLIIGGAFYRKFDARHPRLQWLEPVARFLTRRKTGTFFGDQSPFVRREIFNSLGGFAEIPLMEDVEFSRRLRAAGRVAVLDPPISSSSRRHLECGAWRVTLQNAAFILLFNFGVSPRRLHRWYYRLREKETTTPALATPVDSLE